MKNSLLFLLGCIFICACKDNDYESTPDPAPVSYPDYSNLQVGNYWVYERFLLDTAGGTYTSLNITDSSYIEKDTVVNGETYYKMISSNYPYGSGYGASYIRDSLHYIVGLGGTIIFSSQNFTDTFSTHYSIIATLNDTIAYVYKKMEDNNVAITVPAGTFPTKNMRTTYQMWPNWSTYGTERYMHHRYAENVGMVEQTVAFYQSSPSYTVRRLKSYGPQ